MSQNESLSDEALRQLTVRGFDPELARALLELARDHSTSLNRAALLLMRRGAGLAPPAVVRRAGRDETAIGSGLDRFIGVWSQEDEREFLDSIAALETIDPELWK